jgi:hypothetical protein
MAKATERTLMVATTSFWTTQEPRIEQATAAPGEKRGA